MTSSEMLTIGIDLGGTNAQLGALDVEHGIVARIGLKTQAAEGFDAVLDRLAEGVRELCREASVELEQIASVGIAAPGAIDIPNGVVLEAPNLGWRNVPVRDLLQQRVGRPVLVDNDVNAAAWGEFQLGAAADFADCLGVWLGTGVGGGLVLDGQLYHGSLFTAGEFGQQTIEPHEPRGRRTIEDHCSRTGMSRVIRTWLPEYPDSVLADTAQGPDAVTPNKVLTAAWHDGDALAELVVSNAANLLGIGIANAVTLLAIECVIIGGGVTEALGQPFVDLVRRSFDEYVFPAVNRSCELRITKLEADAGLLGAALLASASVSQTMPSL